MTKKVLNQWLLIFSYLTKYFYGLEYSWGAQSCSASQEIPYLLLNPKVHYRIHESSPLVSIQTKWTQSSLKTYFLNIHSNIIPAIYFYVF